MTPQLSQFPTSRRFSISQDRRVTQRLPPIAAVALVFGLAFAILTEGQIPTVWTKSLLGMLIAPTVVTALWLTGPRDDRYPAEDSDLRQA